jgi:hypothetical protein
LPVLLHHLQGVVEQGFTFAQGLLFHGRPLNAGVRIEADGEEEATLVERFALAGGVKQTRDFI